MKKNSDALFSKSITLIKKPNGSFVCWVSEPVEERLGVLNSQAVQEFVMDWAGQ